MANERIGQEYGVRNKKNQKGALEVFGIEYCTRKKDRWYKYRYSVCLIWGGSYLGELRRVGRAVGVGLTAPRRLFFFHLNIPPSSPLISSHLTAENEPSGSIRGANGSSST